MRSVRVEGRAENEGAWQRPTVLTFAGMLEESFREEGWSRTSPKGPAHRFVEERSMEHPLVVLRSGALPLSPAPPTTRGPVGASLSPDGTSRDQRHSAPPVRSTPRLKVEAKGSGTPLPEAPGALRGGVSPRPPRLDQPPCS
jgi:hypothetical protein